ncbi:MAG: hypothetical protein ACLQU1_08340 [Bryobacteraceae bacterium]
MPTHLDRVIFGAQKDINFAKFHLGSLIEAVSNDLEEFGEKGVQGVKVLGADIERLIKYEKTNQRAKEPYIQAGTTQKHLVVVVRDKKNDKFEAMAYAVKNYEDVRDKLAKSTAAVTNLDKKDPVIDPAAERQAQKFGTKVSDEGEEDYGKITGNIILCAHGRPAAVPSGRIIGDQFGKKTPEEIFKLIAGDRDPNKRIGKDYNGIVTLSGCFTASGGPEASKQDDPFAAKVLQLLRNNGYSKVSVVGMPGPSITAKAGDKDSGGTPLKPGDKYVQANIPGTKEYVEKKRLDAAVDKARVPYNEAIEKCNATVDPYNNAKAAYSATVDPYKKASAAYNATVEPYKKALEAKKAATADKKVEADAAFAKAKADLDKEKGALDLAKAAYEKEKAAMDLAKAPYDKAVKELEDSGLAQTVAHLKGTFGLRTIN